MEFIWNDGGRSACGFVGSTGDCVARAISIATGSVYRDVYEALGNAALKSPRNGVPIDVSSQYLIAKGWMRHDGHNLPFITACLPKGAVVVSLVRRNGRGRHLVTVVDHVIHDTWNPAEDEDYTIQCYWTRQAQEGEAAIIPGQRRISKEQELTQSEFDKILRRLRALDNTANNDASTEGEKHNALRMMQSLMLRHNLTREDIIEEDNVENVQYARVACPLNGRRACTWEVSLANYVAKEIFPTVQWYRATKGHRSLFWFYGPLADVRNTVALFRELLLTIATAAHLRYRSYARGSGASYAEGYVAGLPCNNTPIESSDRSSVDDPPVNSRALVANRTLALHEAALDWLALECNTKLVISSRAGRDHHDPNAAGRGRRDGASHSIDAPDSPKRIGQRPS
jgi:Protein of unknown function (DUF2786)